MNTTIIALARSQVLGSPIMLNSMSQARNFRLHKSQLSMFSNSFLRAADYKGNAMFTNSKFSKFLNSAVRFDSITFQKNIYRERQDVSHPIDNQVIFESCVFQDCKEPESNGGAIYVVNDAITLNLKKVSAANSNAQYGKGGAVYFEGKSFIATMTCFYNCFCEYNGQAIYAVTMSDSYLTFERSNINFCAQNPEKEAEGQNAALFFHRGHQVTKMNNFTNNKVGDLYSAFNTDDSVTFVFTDVSLVNNSGKIMLGLEDSKHDDDLSYCNVIGNIVTDSDYGLIYFTHSLIISHFVFKSNSPQLFHTTETLEVTLKDCVFDKDFSSMVVSNQKIITDGIDVDENPKLYPISRFDTRYCWEVNPEKLPAGPVTYWFLLLFFGFTGLIGYSTYISYKKLSAINPTPLLANPDASYSKTTD